MADLFCITTPLALPYAHWRDFLEQGGPEDYPPAAQIRDIARCLGASV